MYGNSGKGYIGHRRDYMGNRVSLSNAYPEIAKEWHPTKNGDLQPEDVAPKSGKKVWWYRHYSDPITKKEFNFE